MPTSKLPRAIAQMVEKNNLVMAIKTLAESENISMEAAKARIDAYEMNLKAKQQRKLTSIASKQGIPPEAISFSNDPAPTTPDTNKDKDKDINLNTSFDTLHTGLDNKLDSLGYTKPLLPHWAKRIIIILIVMAVIFWGLWRIFN